jgi:hypothetical protein
MKVLGLTFFWILMVCILVSLVFVALRYLPDGKKKKKDATTSPPPSTLPVAPSPTPNNLIIDHIPGYQYVTVDLDADTALVPIQAPGGSVYGYDIEIASDCIGPSKLAKLMEITTTDRTTRVCGRNPWNMPLLVKVNRVQDPHVLFYLTSSGTALRLVAVDDAKDLTLRDLGEGETLQIGCLNWVSQIPMIPRGVEKFTDTVRLGNIIDRAWSVYEHRDQTPSDKAFKMHVWATFKQYRSECILTFRNQYGQEYSRNEVERYEDQFARLLNCNLSNTLYSIMIYVPFVFYESESNRHAYVRRMLVQERFDPDPETREIRCWLSDDEVPFWGTWKVWISTAPKTTANDCAYQDINKALQEDCVSAWEVNESCV